jgi:hypothetical protein
LRKDCVSSHSAYISPSAVTIATRLLQTHTRAHTCKRTRTHTNTHTHTHTHTHTNTHTHTLSETNARHPPLPYLGNHTGPPLRLVASGPEQTVGRAQHNVLRPQHSDVTITALFKRLQVQKRGFEDDRLCSCVFVCVCVCVCVCESTEFLSLTPRLLSVLLAPDGEHVGSGQALPRRDCSTAGSHAAAFTDCETDRRREPSCALSTATTPNRLLSSSVQVGFATPCEGSIACRDSTLFPSWPLQDQR